jgi:hypothetical protein
MLANLTPNPFPRGKGNNGAEEKPSQAKEWG